MKKKEFCEAFAKVVELTKMLEISNLRSLKKLWYHQIDRHWEIYINGYKEEIDDIPPFYCLIKYNGWIAGLISPSGGEIAYGNVANEDTFIEAINTVLLKKKKTKK